MVDSDDGSSIYNANTQDRPDSPPPISLRSIWDCPGITIDQIEDDDGKIIPCWRRGYCPVPGGLGPPPFFKYRNATKALPFLLMVRTLLLARALRIFLRMSAMH